MIRPVCVSGSIGGPDIVGVRTGVRRFERVVRAGLNEHCDVFRAREEAFHESAGDLGGNDIVRDS